MEKNHYFLCLKLFTFPHSHANTNFTVLQQKIGKKEKSVKQFQWQLLEQDLSEAANKLKPKMNLLKNLQI